MRQIGSGLVHSEIVDALRPIDNIGRPIAHRLNPFALTGVALKAGISRRIVPPEFWCQDADQIRGEECAVAVVSCPCGHDPRIEIAQVPAPCQCERWFHYDGTDVWALMSPVTPGDGVDYGQSTPAETGE